MQVTLECLPRQRDKGLNMTHQRPTVQTSRELAQELGLHLTDRALSRHLYRRSLSSRPI